MTLLRTTKMEGILLWLWCAIQTPPGYYWNCTTEPTEITASFEHSQAAEFIPWQGHQFY